jgi:hypothetical protein
MTSLAKALLYLTIIDISKNCVSDESLLAFATSLKESKCCLKEFINKENSMMIQPLGLSELASAFRDSNTLKSVDIGQSYKSSNECDWFQFSLQMKYSKSLKVLKLKNISLLSFDQHGSGLLYLLASPLESLELYSVECMSEENSQNNNFIISETLKEISIRSSNLSSTFFEMFCKRLKENTTPHLRLLNIHDNNVSDCGAIAISEFLLSSQSSLLEELTMSHNGIFDEGISHIVNSLSYQTINAIHSISARNSIQKLYLRSNRFGIIGVNAIASLVRQSPPLLSVVDIRSPELSNEMVLVIREASISGRQFRFINTPGKRPLNVYAHNDLL